MSTRDFLTEILLHRYNVQQTDTISGFFIHFYYSPIIRTFSWGIYCFLIFFQTFPYIYDVTTLEIICPITFQNYTKHSSKCCKIKIICEHATFFIKWFPALIQIFLYQMYFIRESFLRYKTNIFMSHF